MALRWLEGFESPDTSATYWGRKYASGIGLTGTHAGRVTGTAIVVGSSTLARTPSLGSDKTWTVGIAWKGNDVPGGNHHWEVNFYSSATKQLTLDVQVVAPSTDATIKVKRGSTVLATVGGVSALGWHYIELKVSIDTGTAGAYELRVDLVNVASNGATNTADGGVANADIIEFHGIQSSSGYWDDIYICDSTTGDGLGNDTFRGDTQIVGFKPNGNGAIRQWSRSSGANDYTLVADASDSSYLSDSTVGHETVMDFEDPSIPSGTIFGMMLTSLASLDVAGSRQYATEYYNGSTTFPFPTNHVVGSTTITGYVDVVEANPDTLTNWLASEINAGQFGLKLTV